MGRILVVDDDESFRTVLRHILASSGHEVEKCGSVDEAIALFGAKAFDLVVSDIKMEPVDGLVLLQKIHAARPEIPVIMLTAYASVETALDALKMGAFDFITKPFKLDAFTAVVERALQTGDDPFGSVEAAAKLEESCCFPGVVGVSPSMKATCRMIELVAPTEASVLLSGEKGTGRSLLASVMHDRSRRRDKARVSIECGELPADAPEIALVGRAVQEDREEPGGGAGAGLMAAEGGTVILENVHVLPSAAQAVLMDVLRDRTVIDPSSGAAVPLNIRVVATADAGLHAAVKDGSFRGDLFRRLSLVSVDIPPVRDRVDDILPLVWFFLRQAAGEGAALPELAVDARGAFKHYLWPSNVTELKRVVQYAWANRVGGRIVRESLPKGMLQTLTESRSVFTSPVAGVSHAASLMEFLRRKGVDMDKALAQPRDGHPTRS